MRMDLFLIVMDSLCLVRAVAQVKVVRKQEMLLVFGVSSVGLIINQLILLSLVGWAQLDLVASKALATGGVFFWNYILRSRWIFLPPSK